MSRVEQVAAELASGTLVEKLREKHDVIAYRFDQAKTRSRSRRYPRKPTQDETAESQSVGARTGCSRCVAESRSLVYVRGGVLAIVADRGTRLSGRRRRKPSPQQPSAAASRRRWALLVSMTTLIAAVVILAVAMPARLGGRPAGDPRPARAKAGRSSATRPPGKRSKRASPAGRLGGAAFAARRARRGSATT